MRMHVPLHRPQPWVMPVTLVCLALGALVASMLSVTTPEAIDPNMRPDDKLRYVMMKNEELETETKKLQMEKDQIVNDIAKNVQNQKIIIDELNKLRIATGSTPVEGRGIVVTIDDTGLVKGNTPDLSEAPQLTHDVDLLLLINELRSAKAEALAINDQRVVASSAIRCVGPVINVNNQPVSPPFVVRAIGKPDVLAGAVNLPYGVLDQLKALNIHVTVAKRDKLRVPAITVLPTLDEGKVAPDAEGAATKP